MGTKVEQASVVGSVSIQTSLTATSASASSGPKASMFAAKSGFVIPKNKLSGSLVPVYRGSKKLGGRGAANAESTTQVQRKTKWSPDLTQDAAVRKGRAAAYQIRLDQITQQLKSGGLEIEDTDESTLASQIPDDDSSRHDTNNEFDLELERREVIGEILKLNPTYKAPADYKPLLKEAQVPIPIKDYPSYNFIGLILDPASDTQKQLEKETGAKVRVYGTKTDKGEKVAITPSDGTEIQNVYNELYVHVSADTYEKVDAAVALIELLVTPVSANPVAVSTTSTTVSDGIDNAINSSQGTTPILPSVGNQGVVQPTIGFAPAPPQGQFQSYPGPWLSTGPSSGFITSQTPSTPKLTSSAQASPSSLYPANVPSLFGPRPQPHAGFGTVPQVPSLFLSRPLLPNQIFQSPNMPLAASPGYTGPPRNYPMPAWQSTPSMSAPPFSVSQPPPAETFQALRPLMSSLPRSTAMEAIPDRPLNPAVSPVGLSNLTRMVPPPGPGSETLQHIVSGAPSNFSAGNMVSHTGLTSRAPAPPSSASAGHPLNAPTITSISQPQMGYPSAASLIPTPAASHGPMLSQSSATAPMLTGTTSFTNPVLGSTPVCLPVMPKPTGPSLPPVRPPPLTTPKPLHPSSNDFTFQPHRPQNPVSNVIPGPGDQPVSLRATTFTVQLPHAHHAPSFQPSMHNLGTRLVVQGFPGSVGNQMNQPRTDLPDTFTGSSNAPHAVFRPPAFPNLGPVTSTPPGLQIGPRDFSPVPQMLNSGGPVPPRPGNPMQLQQNYPATVPWPQGPSVSNQQFNGNPAFGSGIRASSMPGVQQIYDPFSPTSISNAPQQGFNPPRVKNQDSDPEYEDLMASVGVR